MGKGQSKQKGGKKGKGSKEEAASASPAAAAASPAPAKNEAVEAKVEEEDIDWDAPTLYAKNNKKVGVEDFELLKVIGKGSFGKVTTPPEHLASRY